MQLELSPDIRMQRLRIGSEKVPLLVIDNFVRQPDDLIRWASSRLFANAGRHFPGIRTRAPLTYRKLIQDHLQDELSQFFEVDARLMQFPMAHYSLVTTPPAKLEPIQRIPHVDSVRGNGLATVHYLFRDNHGGTAFYRHRRTGFEYVDEARQDAYFRTLQEEMDGPDFPGPEYINGDTALFEQVAMQAGTFNRMLVYRRNSLHSGCIAKTFVPDPNPLTGRLSINCFIDVAP
jgi:hypothetical protein